MSELPAARYETRDATPWHVVAVGAGVALGIAAVAGAAGWMLQSGPPGGRRQTSFREGAASTTSVAVDWRRQDAAVARHLHDYGWVDRDAGIVRIPIERAMDLVVRDAASPSPAP